MAGKAGIPLDPGASRQLEPNQRGRAGRLRTRQLHPDCEILRTHVSLNGFTFNGLWHPVARLIDQAKEALGNPEPLLSEVIQSES